MNNDIIVCYLVSIFLQKNWKVYFHMDAVEMSIGSNYLTLVIKILFSLCYLNSHSTAFTNIFLAS